jgi:hypothetical protein
MIVMIELVNNIRQKITMKIILFVFLGLVVLLSVLLGIFFLLSGKPSVISNHVIIQRPQEIVFDFVADMRNELKWNPDVQTMEKLTEGPIGIGTNFLAKWTLSDTINVEITRYERPYYVTFVNGGKLSVTLELSLSSSGNKTEMSTKFIATPHGFLRAIFPVMKNRLKSQEQKNMENLKRFLERTL